MITNVLHEYYQLVAPFIRYGVMNMMMGAVWAGTIP
mgnify:CR=1 FL=1